MNVIKIIRNKGIISRPIYNSVRKMCSNSSVVVQKDGKVTLIGINRPEKRNCVDKDTAEKLKVAFEDFEKDDTSYVAVLHGIGGNFCAGYDLSELSSLGNEQQDWSKFYTETGTVGPTMRFIKKPTIAAVSGYAVAGGFELALMCDLRVIEDNAIMGVFCRRFGVPLIDGGTVRLQAMVGLSRALDFILTGRAISAKESFECGISNRIVAVGTGLGQAIQLANSLIKFPQLCMRADRASTYNAAFSSSYEELLKYERENGFPIVLEESVKGAQQFVSGVGRHGKFYHLKEKEIPDWEKDEDQYSKVPKNKL